MAEKEARSRIDLYIIGQVKKLRLKKGFKQADLAAHLKLSTGFVGQVEMAGTRAKYNPDHLNKLARLLECSPKDFLPRKPL